MKDETPKLPKVEKRYWCDYCGHDYYDSALCCERRKEYLEQHESYRAKYAPASQPTVGGEAALDFLDTTAFTLLLDPDGEKTVPLHDVFGSSPPGRVTLVAGTREQPVPLYTHPAPQDAKVKALVEAADNVLATAEAALRTALAAMDGGKS